VSGVGSTAATAVTAAAPAIANSTNPMGGIEQQIPSTTGNDPQALQNAAISAMQAVVMGDEATAADARNRAADAIAKAQGIPADQGHCRSLGRLTPADIQLPPNAQAVSKPHMFENIARRLRSMEP